MGVLYNLYRTVVQKMASLVLANVSSVKMEMMSYVTKSQYSRVHGVPDIMYFLPEYHGHDECLVDVSQQQIDEMEEHCQIEELGENIYHEYFVYVMKVEGLANIVSKVN